ncbi:MAG: TonB-dependent receptor [Acidobacteria bacterium]|nr:TonB-dependent receptor [Acidobacteriota bacterium]
MIPRTLLLVFALSLPVAAQTITGALTGTVTDPTGAVVPNVKVTAVSRATNLESTTTSNTAGVYNLLFLPVGSYNLTAEVSGFKKTVLGPFTLEVNQTARVDINLQVGEVTQSVEIVDIAPILQTESTQTGDVITGTTTTALPINGRSFASLTLLVPGSITPNPGSFNSPSRAFSGGRPYVNGNREQGNNFLLDGVDSNETVGNVVGYNPNLDAIGEIKILTGNAPAEFGNAMGATVVSMLKSGTNQFRGNVFEFLRNDKLDANSFFANRLGASKRALRQNIFGGTLGGPIVKNRHFFFVDYEGTRQVNSGPATASVAPAAWRSGDLSAFLPNTPIRDPLLSGNCTVADRTACFPGNLIPQSRIVSPVARALFADQRLYPLPNNIGTGPLGVNGNYLASSASSIRNDQADAKIDSRLTDKDNLSGRFTIARHNSGGSRVQLPILMTTVTEAPTTGGVITWTRVHSPTIVNEARIGFNLVVINTNTIDPTGLLGPEGNQKLGIPGGQPIPGASAVGLGEVTGVGAAASNRAGSDPTFQYGDNLTWQHGRHTLKGGFQWLRYRQNSYYAGNNGVLGRFDYTGAYTNGGFSDFLLNQLRAKGRGSLSGKWGHRQSRVGLFFQDDFKMRPNLTLNLGMRWEYTQPVYEVADRQSSIDLITGKQLFAGKDGNSRALYDSYWGGFEPRLGFAWTPSAFRNKLVVRAGYAITSFMEGTGANLRLPLNPPFFFESDITYDTNAPGDIRTGFTDVRPQIQLSGQPRAWDPKLRPAFIQQWNFTLEYQFSPTFSLNAGYVGQRGRHLVDPREYNQPLPDPGPPSTWRPLQVRRPLNFAIPLVTNISGTDSSATMDYNSLQASGRKRLGHGLEFLASYTLSKTLTDNLGYYGSGGVNAEGAYWQNAYNRVGNRGPSFFDAKHNFSFAGFYELPVGRGRAFAKGMNRAADLVFGGWTANYIVSLHSGFPVTLITSTDPTRQAVRGNVRPNRYRPLTYSGQSIDNWFGTGNAFCQQLGVDDGKCAYGVPADGQFGTAAIGAERAPDFRNLDFGIGKKFAVTEAKYFDFRAEFFNFFNHSSFGPPNRNIASPSTFGIIGSTITSPRNIEMALKFYF